MLNSRFGPYPGLALLIVLAGSVQARAASLPDFTALVRDNSAAVVNIGTTQTVSAQDRVPLDRPDLPDGYPFGDLFKYFFGQPDDDEGGVFKTESLGSGFIIDSHGYVLTNHHVVEDAQQVTVRLSDRRELPARVIGSDARSDIALLKVEATDLPVVTIGRSSELQVGAWVLAIGSPFGFEQSVTAGIVSAKGRSLPRENYVPFIQTDVAINPGNSGGPLFNMDGEVVGINSQIYSRTGGYMGLSFAIPIEMAMEVAEQLKAKGKVSRGWLGVFIQEVTRELAESFGMDKTEGALVAQVFPDSPAAAAGLEPGDVIVEFDGKPVETSTALPPLVGRTAVGKKVQVKLIRAGRPLVVELTIAELPEEESLAAAEPPSAPSVNRLGLAVTEVPSPLREELGLEPDEGVLAEAVEGAAAKADIREGDVILILNGQRITGAQSFERIVQALPGGESVPVLVQRGDRNREFLALEVPNQ